MQNPLFPTGQDTPAATDAGNAGEPLLPADDEASRQAAADLIRRKVAAAYAAEPDAAEELKEVAQLSPAAPVSKHQAYMQDLQVSGKSLAEIQAAWHSYYISLPDHEKHEVWREFYSGQSGATPFQQHLQQREAEKPVSSPVTTIPARPAADNPSQPSVPAPQPRDLPLITLSQQAARPAEPAAVAAEPKQQSIYDSFLGRSNAAPVVPKPSAQVIKQRILDNVSAGGKLKAKHHLQSLGFGLASGLVVIFIFLFSFFNEVLIAPFIQPSRHASETPVIIDPASAVVSGEPKVIIPKINVEIPVDYSQTSTDDAMIEAALDQGVVHYPTTVRPGQPGNSVFFGHSSNNIFNPGKYKFAFVLLHELREGDTYYLTYEGKAYAYKVVQRRVVEPTEISVLGPVAGYGTTSTLITCDPPGTSLKRLVVVGEQISPVPPAPTETPQPQQPAPVISATSQTNLPGNGPTLWSRLWGELL